MNITGDVPVASFKNFLPAVQRGKYVITSENVEVMRTLAEQWEVPALIEECNHWEVAPDPILRRLAVALQNNDRTAISKLVAAVAGQLDLFLSLPQFIEIPPKVIGDILSHAKCTVTDHQTLLNALFAVLTANPGPNVSALLNHVVVGSLNLESIERVLTNDNLDLNSASEFVSKNAARAIQSGKAERERIQRLECQIAKVRKQCDDINANIRLVHQNLEEEKCRHLEHQAELRRVRQQYEPDVPTAPNAMQGQKKGGGKRKGTTQFVYYPDDDLPEKAEVPQPLEQPPVNRPRAKRINTFSWSPEDGN
jgi:hypothetical protein